MENKIKLVMVLASLGTVFLYFIGSTMWSAELRVYGIPNNLFPMEAQEYILHGYLALAFGFGKILARIGFLLILATFVIIPFFSWMIKRNPKGFLAHLFAPIEATYNKELFGVGMSFFLFLLPLIITGSWMTTTVKLFTKITLSKSILSIEEQEDQNASIIIMNNHCCAYFDQKEILHIVPSSTISEITSIPKPKKEKSK